MTERELVRIRHMLDAALEALAFGASASREDLDRDRMLALALAYSLQTIGEAATHVSETSRNQHPEIPWDDIIGMRHRLVHGYDNINLNVVWHTLTEDLPPLIGALERILAESKGNQE